MAPETFYVKELPQDFIPTLMESPEAKTAKEGIRALLKLAGEDPDREGLLDTPKRVVKALLEMMGGNHLDPKSVLGVVFKDDIHYDEMIVLTNIHCQSLCEHHLLPFSVIADVGYIPSKEGGVLGISKLARLVDIYSRRPQVQEKLTQQIANTLNTTLNPLGVAVRIRGEHSCMSCRGIKLSGSVMTTQQLLGAFKDNADTRAEWMSHINY
jgi:GTP cyclohydrolase I